ncbi:MAG: helix-turn-helix domain-containing protein [Enhydrobacter sp.]|nr:MAG: helix-turn-helix domain-containing protein [Enhydrobacter sp.]
MPDQVDWRSVEREATPGRAVGRLLRDQREAKGLGVADVERRLRIRHQHIEAIEQGRFDLLPGAAYIPAFLRAYAAHLDLDPEKVLTAYHLSGAVPIKRPVALPADFPIVERRAPVGLAVLTVLLVVAAGYAVWHYLPRQQTVVAEKVPPVPDRLLASQPAPAPTEQTSIVVPDAKSEVKGVRQPQSVSPAYTWPGTSPVRGSQEESSAVASPQAPPHPPTPAPAPVVPPIVVAVPASPPPVVMTAPGIGQAQAAQPAPEPQQARAVPAPETQPTPAEPTPPAVSLPTRSDTPVLVRTNSWVELRAPNGDILAMTYVRAGESYVVPAGIAYRVIDAR